MTRQEWKKINRQKKHGRILKYNISQYKLEIAIPLLSICVVAGGLIFVMNHQKGENEQQIVQNTEKNYIAKTQVVDAKEQTLEIETEIESETEPQEIVEKLIAKHTISYSSSSKDRNTNMSAAAKIINGDTKGYILEPEEKFSWLAVVGETTPEKGFLPAPVIVNRRSATDYGGGVCQVSSTINSAIQAAGITGDNVKAQKHSLPSHYIDESRGDREATVSFDSKIDFSFVNPFDYAIRIKVTTDGNSVTVKVYKREVK